MANKSYLNEIIVHWRSTKMAKKCVGQRERHGKCAVWKATTVLILVLLNTDAFEPRTDDQAVTKHVNYQALSQE